jgi:hypothetical protein
MAMDQDALDEHVRTTDQLAETDEFMGNMFRGDGDRDPIINGSVPRRCEVIMTRIHNARGVSS